MNRTILLTILFCFSMSHSWAQEADTPVEAARLDVPLDPTESTSPTEILTQEPATDDTLAKSEPTSVASREVFPGEDTNKSRPVIVQELIDTLTQSDKDAPEIRVFRLKYVNATDAAQLLRDLITTGPFRTVPDERTNSVIATGTADQLLTVEALLLKLDEAENRSLSSPKSDDNQTTDKTSKNELPQQVAQLRTDYEAVNKQAHGLAESLRKTPDNAKKAELRTAVQRAFTLRQSLLRAELVDMQTRLLETQRSIDMRERIADQIVDRRVEDLLNPQLEWEQNRTSLNRYEGGTKNRIAASADTGRLASSTASGDSRATLLARVQGTWDVEVHSNENPDGRSSTGMKMVCEIRDNQLAYLMNGESQLSYTIGFGEPTTPQPIDLVEDLDGQKFRPGIIEINDDLVRICLPNQADDLKRPKTFAYGNATDIHVLRRPTPPAIPKVLQPATEEQKLRWRSGIVDIMVYGNSKDFYGGSEVTIGRGVVVSDKGLIVTHLAGGWEHGIKDYKIDAKFDDGSRVSLEIAEEERGGILVLQPLRGAEINHFFSLATTLYSAGDEVYVGTNDTSSPEHRLAIVKSRVILTDRRMATADSLVWQLEGKAGKDLLGGQPVLSATGELLGITLQNTGELLLAVPAEYLKLFFSKTLGQAEKSEEDSVPGQGSAAETPD